MGTAKDGSGQPHTRTEAQQRADDIHVYRRERARLHADGLLAADDEGQQRVDAYHARLLEQLETRFDIDRDQQASRLSLGMRVASLLGALALAASIFFLFYQFWGYLPVAAQVSILAGASLASCVATFMIRARDDSGYFSKLAAMVAFACFVLNIAMFGQIFNITPSDKALLVWGAYALLLAYACDLRLLLVMAILCLTTFIAARFGTWSGLYWFDFGERPENFFPAAVLLFALPLYFDHRGFAGFPVIYRVFALLTLFLPMLVLSNWGYGSYIDFDSDVVEVFYQILGFILSAAVIWLGVRRGWNDVVNTGVTFFVIFLYTRFFDWWWDYMPKSLFFLVLGLVSILLLLVMRRLRAAGLFSGREVQP